MLVIKSHTARKIILDEILNFWRNCRETAAKEILPLDGGKNEEVPQSIFGRVNFGKTTLEYYQY